MSQTCSDGTLVFLRGQQDDSELSDIWDDSALIQAYDKAVGLAYDQIKPTNLQVGNSRDAGNQSGRKKRKKKTGGKARSKMQWNVGDECYSQFIEDGEWYAAQIESIDVSQNTCVVKYKYYGNKEEQNLSSLHRLAADETSSQDESIAKDFSNTSGNDNDGLPKRQIMSTGEFSQYQPNPVGSAQALPGNLLGRLESLKQTMTTIPRLPPPPPPPPRSYLNRPAVDDDEALVSMLMSWYMSGYHTGYYQARQDMKK